MNLRKRGQLQHECNTLKRWLAFLKEENIILKNRLSEILKDSFNKNLLEEAELFHNAFIREDERMHLLRNDVAELEKLHAIPVYLKETINNEIDAMLLELRNNINIAGIQFLKVQSDFNKYFYEKISSDETISNHKY